MNNADLRREMRERFARLQTGRPGPALAYRDGAPFDDRGPRFARTTTSVDHPTYPGSGQVFVIELGKPSYTESPGAQTLTFTPYSPARIRVAYSLSGYLPEQTTVSVFRAHGQWFCERLTAPAIVEVDLTADLCGAAPTVSAAGVLLPDRRAIDVSGDTLTNSENRRAQSGDTIRLIMVNENPLTWDVLSVPKRKVANMIGVEHTSTCLRAWALEQAGEWCSDDESVDANEVIDYRDCEGNDLGACSTTITFDPLYFATT